MFSVQYRLVLVIYVLSLLWKSINTLSFRKISIPFRNVCIKCQIAGNVGAKTQYLGLVFVLNSKVRLYSTSKHFIYDSFISNLTVDLFRACKTYQLTNCETVVVDFTSVTNLMIPLIF